MGKEYPPRSLADYRGLEERRELPSGVRSRAPAANAFWQIWGSQNTSGRENSMLLYWMMYKAQKATRSCERVRFVDRLYVMKISHRRLRICDSLKISNFSNSLGVLQHPQQYVYVCHGNILISICPLPRCRYASSKNRCRDKVNSGEKPRISYKVQPCSVQHERLLTDRLT